MNEIDDYKTFTYGKNPIGGISSRRNGMRSAEEQKCIIHISLLPHPEDPIQRKEQKKDRKIWVKLNEIYIFNEDFGMHGWDEIRVSVELVNENDNEIDTFITPSPNKTYSKLNNDFKKRVVSLINYSANSEWFTLAKGYRRPKVPKKICEQTWIDTFGEVFKHPCHISWCTNMITAFDFQTGHNIAQSNGGSMSPENLKPICSRCNSSMGIRTIDEWNLMGRPETDV